MTVIRTFLYLLLAFGAVPTFAAGKDCAVHDWLVQGYHLAANLDRDQTGSRGTRAARDLLNLLGAIPQADLDALLRDAGLQRHGQTIQGFLTSQHAVAQRRLAGDSPQGLPPATTRQMRQFSSQMQSFVANLRCDDDPDWRPAKAVSSAAQGATAIQRQADPPAGGIPRVVSLYWLAAGLLGLSVILWLTTRLVQTLQQRHRRRSRRFLCHLPCTVVRPGVARPGTVMDISQLGAKVFLGHSLPPEVTALDLLLPGQHIRARVVWRNSQFCGLAFKTPLDRLALHDLLRKRRAAKPGALQNETAPRGVP